MKKNIVTKLLVALFGIVAVAGLAFNIMAYSHLNQELAVAQSDDKVVEKMVEVINLKALLTQLDSGDTNMTRQMLSLNLAGKLQKLAELKGTASSPVDQTVDVLARVVNKSPKRHGEFNLSMAQPSARQ